MAKGYPKYNIEYQLVKLEKYSFFVPNN